MKRIILCMAIILWGGVFSFSAHATEVDLNKPLDVGVFGKTLLADAIRCHGRSCVSFQAVGCFIRRDEPDPDQMLGVGIFSAAREDVDTGTIPRLPLNREEGGQYKKGGRDLVLLSNIAGDISTTRTLGEFDPSSYDTSADDVSDIVLVGAGILGGAIGFFGGGAIGAASCDWSTREASCIAPTLVTAAIGESILLPLFVHLANRRRGKLTSALLASVSITAASVGATVETGQPVILIPIPVLQLIGSVWIEERAHTAAKIAMAVPHRL